MTKISVLGTGYLGATHAACMAYLGHEVTAFDVDPLKINRLSNGITPFVEPGLDELIVEGLKNNRLKFSHDLKEVISSAEIHFICVGTPQLNNSGATDLSQIFSLLKSIVPHLTNDSIIVGKSTVPVGTAQVISDYLSEHSKSRINLIWNPEFLREGYAVQDTLNPDRIVLGKNASSEDSIQALLNVYKNSIESGTPIIVTDFATAELVKLAANSFLATKISFINAFADLCDVTGANIATLADAIGFDDRIGRKFLNAGIGFGGGCLPKDIRALKARANELGLNKQFNFLNDVDEINNSRISKVIKIIQQEIGPFKNKKIAILGASFKPNSDDIRNAPSIILANKLRELQANVVLHDPVSLSNVNSHWPDIKTAENFAEVFDKADIILHLTEWDHYRRIDPAEIKNYVNNKIIVDGRNVLDQNLWKKSGWKIIYLGKPGS